MAGEIEIRKPTVQLTEEQKNTAIELAIEGMSLRRILDKILISSYHFYKYKQSNPKFEDNFATARLEGLEHLADDLLDIADDHSIDVNRARLKSDNSKWVLSKRKPQIYGDRLNLEVSTTIDIGTALNEARKRAALDSSNNSHGLLASPSAHGAPEAMENNIDIIDIKSNEDSKVEVLTKGDIDIFE